jgi:hypothetical protein
MRPFIALLQDSDALTFGEVIRDIPHDLPAIVVYLMIGAFIYAIWRANRRRPQA